MFIIAEMACSHNGIFNKAKKLVKDAAASGADAIQFQIWSLKYMMAPNNKLFKKLKKIEFRPDEWVKLIKYTKNNYPKLKIFCCLYDHKSFSIIKNLNIDGIKINSSDLTNPLVLKEASKFKKIINLSVGASSLHEINYAIKLINKKKINLMYGIQNFPTKLSEVNLMRLNQLKNLYGYPVGYQDHSSYKSPFKNVLCFMAMAMGVKILEKHICYTREKNTYDYESALDKNEFKKFVVDVKNFENSLGNKISNNFSNAEKKYRNFQKKSIVIINNKKIGDKIKIQDVAFLRTNNVGISPHKLQLVVNRKLKTNVNAYNPIRLNYLK